MTEIKLDHANRQLQLNTFQEVINGKTVVYFITQKRNNSGTLYNLRFFIIQEPDRISYSTKIDDNIVLPFRKVSNIPTTKATIMIKDILKVEAASDLTMMVMFEAEEGSKMKPYWILKFQTKAIMESVQERISKLRNRMAMQLRGTGGMLDGPNSVSKFKKSVEVSLSNNKVPNPEQSPQNGYTKWKQIAESPRKQKEPQTPAPTIKRQIKFMEPETVEKLEKPAPTPIPSPDIKPVATPPPPPLEPSYKWLIPFITKPYKQALKQFTQYYTKNIKIIASLKHNTWVDHDDALIKIQQGSSDYISLWQNIRYLHKKLKPQSKIRLPLFCFLKYNNLMILIKCKLPTQTISKPQQAIQAIQSLTKCTNISLQLAQMENPHSIHKKIWIIENIEHLLPEDKSVKRTVGLKTMQWLDDQTKIKEIINKKVEQATQQLNKAEFISRKQLKAILSSFGLTLCHLHLICPNISSKVARRYVFTMMVAQRIGQRYFGKNIRQNIHIVAQQLSEEYKVQGKQVILGLVYLCLLEKWGVKGLPQDMDVMEYEVRVVQMEQQEEVDIDDLDELEEKIQRQKLPLSLCDFISPNDSKYKKISKNLYDCQDISYRSWKIQYFHIKWLLLQQNPEAAIELATKLQKQIRTWLFGLSPILFDTLILLGRYHSSNNNPQAIKFIQNSIQCFTQCFDDKQQLININNQLASALLKHHNFQQTIEIYQKMLNDLKEIGVDNTVVNAEMLYSLSKVQLKLGRLLEAKENCLESLKIYYSLNDYQDEIVDCYELLSRVAQLDDSELLQTIGQNCSNGIGELKKIENFEKMLRMVLLPRLDRLQKNQKQALTEIIEDIPRMANGYQKSYTFLRDLVNKSNLIPSLKRCFSECENSTIKKSLPEWRRSIVPDDTKDKFQKHLLLLESLSNFLGLNFMLGALEY